MLACCTARPPRSSHRQPESLPPQLELELEPELEREPELQPEPERQGRTSAVDEDIGTMESIMALHNLTREQRLQCLELRQRLPPDADDGLPTSEMVVRFLRATRFQPDTKHRDPAHRTDMLAERMLRRHVAWRREWRPDDLTADDCPTAMRSGAGRIVGVGPRGNPVLWAQAGLWNPHEYSLEEFVRYVAFFNATSERLMSEHGTNTGVFIIDVSGWEIGYLKHLDKIKMLIDAVQNQYPERLECALLINVPFIFMGAWKLISPMIDANTREKIHFVSADELDARLRHFMSPEIIPQKYGGLYQHDEVPGQYIYRSVQQAQLSTSDDDDEFHELLPPEYFGLTSSVADGASS